MSGAYCDYCSRRCFVYRLVPDGPGKGWGGHMATCRGGMAHDLKALDHTHLTAINPVTDPDAAEAVYAWKAGEHGRKALALAVEASQSVWFSGQVDAMFPDPAQAPGTDRMTDAHWLHIALTLRDKPGHYSLVRSYWNKAAVQESCHGA